MAGMFRHATSFDVRNAPPMCLPLPGGCSIPMKKLHAPPTHHIGNEKK
jgi:hypothetical protein